MQNHNNIFTPLEQTMYERAKKQNSNLTPEVFLEKRKKALSKSNSNPATIKSIGGTIVIGDPPVGLMIELYEGTKEDC